MAAHSVAGRRFRPAPPVAPVISGKNWEASQREHRLRDHRQLNAYDKDNERRGGAHATAPRTERDHYFTQNSRPAASRANSNYANQADRSVRTAAATPAKSIKSAKSVTDASEFSFNIRDNR